LINGAPGVDQVVQDSSVLDKFYRLLDGRQERGGRDRDHPDHRGHLARG